ncbi:MAG: OmpA family protein [Bacteroidales bacterium]|nr:OmpA family protein [Bacteroidales bacterium]
MNLKWLFILWIGWWPITMVADGGGNCETTSSKAHRLYEKSIELLNSGQKEKRREAYSMLVEAINIDENYADANFALADINYQKSLLALEPKRKEQLENRAIKYFEKVKEQCPSNKDYESFYYIGKILYSRLSYTDALKALEVYEKNNTEGEFKKELDRLIEKLRAYFYLKANPVEFKPVKLEGISTDDDEFLPIISPDGELAIYTHRYVFQDPELSKAVTVDELSLSRKVSSSKDLNELFSKGKRMTNPFNQKDMDQGAMSITIDNKELYITICQFIQTSSGPHKNCDIYVSYNRNGEWSDLYNLGTNINGKYSWESQPSISADGKKLYFASVRPENIGFDINNNQTADIYYSIKDANGRWCKAINIGPTINTLGNEKSPFMHTDSRTLYFSSDEHPGVGGYDIFYSKETTDGWSKPVNIGYPINTEDNDLGFFVSTNGKKAYFSSDKLDDYKRWNIYSFNLYEKARPEKVFFAKGKLVDEKGDVITDAKVEIHSAQSNTVVEGMVDKQTGDYAIAVAVEKNEEVLLTVKKENHAFTSKYIKVDEKKESVNEPIKVDLKVKKLEVGKAVQINDIHFATNSAMFMKGSLFILDNFVQYLKENQNIRIEIHGHTDNVGSSRSNKKLSEQRARTVRDYIVFQGIDPSRVTAYKGFGESKPIATNETEKGRAQNRRTEFVIVAY